MKLKSLEQVYKHLYIKSNNYIVESNKPVSRGKLAALIASQDSNLEPGSSSKDVRIQPTGPYDSSNFIKTLEDSNLKLIRTAKPGEEGSTSGQLLTYIVQDEHGNEYPVTLGKGLGFGTRDEDTVLESLKSQISDILLAKPTDYILLDINGYIQKIDGVETTPGTPKSDFHFTYKGRPVMFISHKAGKKASDYQQYGGTTCKSGESICSHKEVIRFIDQIKEKYPDGMPPGVSLWKSIEDAELKKMALFGADYGGEYGINNVNALYQGSITIAPGENNTYILNALHVVYNGDIPEGEYTPVLYARYSGSRGGNHGIKDMRSSISPIAKVSAKQRGNEFGKALIKREAVNKKIKSFAKFFEEVNGLKKAVIAYGRYNPPTTGHERLIDKVREIGDREQADMFIIPTHTTDTKKNPLDINEKIEILKQMAPDMNIIDSGKTLISLLKDLQSKGYNSIIHIAGSDRIGEFESLIGKYNNKPDKSGDIVFSFKEYKFESSGERDPDSDNIEGMSASKLRALALHGDYNAFAHGMSDKVRDSLKRETYNKIRERIK